MKKIAISIFLLTALFINSCKNYSIVVGKKEWVKLTYSNSSFTGQINPSAIFSEKSPYVNISATNITTDTTASSIDIILDGLSITNGKHNFKINKYTVSECDGTNCANKDFHQQTEFNTTQNSSLSEITAVLVLDVSTSLGGHVDDVKSYAKDFAKSILDKNSESHVAIVLFSENIDTLGFFDSSGISQINSFIDGYTNYGSRTTLYGACKQGLNMLNNYSGVGFKTLIVFTDGGDNNTNNPDQVLSQIKSSTIKRYAIGLDGTDFNKDNLKDIASSTENMFVAKKFEDLEGAFDEVSSLVNTIYKIKYSRSKQILSQAIEIKFEFEVEKIN